MESVRVLDSSGLGGCDFFTTFFWRFYGFLKALGLRNGLRKIIYHSFLMVVFLDEDSTILAFIMESFRRCGVRSNG